MNSPADGFRGPFAVADGRIIHNAGGSEAQELAFALASAVAYLRALEAGGMALDAARGAIYFRLSADAEQFLTMAKFRAVRKLWARVEAACGLTPKPVMVAAETAWRMMTRRDPYVNMLRNAIAVAAAGLGGADTIAVLPHTAPLGLPDAFARRVARNTQLSCWRNRTCARRRSGRRLRRDRSHHEELCTAAWSLFQEIEKAGGAWAALECGTDPEEVAAVRAERQKAVARRKDMLTGTNEYPEFARPRPRFSTSRRWPSPKDEPAAVVHRRRCRASGLPSRSKRLRDASDQILAKTGARPKIFLANLGKPAEFTAARDLRQEFLRGRRHRGGGRRRPSRPDLAAAFKASGAGLACLCSSDKIYEARRRRQRQALKAAGADAHLSRRPARRARGRIARRRRAILHLRGCDALATLEGRLRYSGSGTDDRKRVTR